MSEQLVYEMLNAIIIHIHSKASKVSFQIIMDISCKTTPKTLAINLNQFPNISPYSLYCCALRGY